MTAAGSGWRWAGPDSRHAVAHLRRRSHGTQELGEEPRAASGPATGRTPVYAAAGTSRPAVVSDGGDVSGGWPSLPAGKTAALAATACRRCGFAGPTQAQPQPLRLLIMIDEWGLYRQARCVSVPSCGGYHSLMACKVAEAPELERSTSSEIG